MRRMHLLVVLYLLLCCGLAYAETTAPEVPWRIAPGRGLTIAASPGLGEERRPVSAATEPAELSLRDALVLALKGNPELSAFSQEVRANEASVLQAGVLPNPVLEIVGDNLANTRKAEAGDRSSSLQIGQLIELGGKRALRIQLAETGLELANWDYETKRIEVVSRLAQRFVDVLAAQSRQALADESAALAHQVVEAVAKRVQAGKVSPVEETKARLALASAEVESEQAKRELIATRNALGALWGEPSPHFQKAMGDLTKLAPLPSYAALTLHVRNNPELARWQTEILRRQARVEAERAKAVPDITVSAGVSRFSQFDDRAYMLGIAIPIPVFDRNRGGILEASRRLDKAGDERRAVEMRLLTELAQAYQRLAAIDKEIQILRTSLLPGAQSAFDAATKGYQLGKFSFLDVLDAQRTLFQARTQNLRALADYQRGASDLERLIGGALESPAVPKSLK